MAVNPSRIRNKVPNWVLHISGYVLCCYVSFHVSETRLFGGWVQLRLLFGCIKNGNCSCWGWTLTCTSKVQFNKPSLSCYTTQWNGKCANKVVFVCASSAQYGLFMSRWWSQRWIAVGMTWHWWVLATLPHTPKSFRRHHSLSHSRCFFAAPSLPNVKIQFLFCQIVLLRLYSLLSVEIKAFSNWVEKHLKFSCFFLHPKPNAFRYIHSSESSKKMHKIRDIDREYLKCSISYQHGHKLIRNIWLLAILSALLPEMMWENLSR